jgi:hypothetical protein
MGGPQPREDSSYVGDYVLVVDAEGKRIWEGGEADLGDGSSQLGGADRWDLEGCDPYFRSGPPGRGPPPCPVGSRSETHASVTTRIVGATAKQETVLREILAGLAPTIIEEVRISPARKPEWTPFKPNSVVVSVKYSNSPENERGEWEAALLSEAFATRSRLLRLQPVAAYQTSTGGVALDGPREPKPDTRTPIGSEELSKTLTEAARASGAEIVDLRVLKPMNPAAAMTLRVQAPAFYLKHRLRKLMGSVPGSDRQYDGLYVRIVDSQGRFVWISAQTNGDSISGGAVGARKDLQGCDPTPMFGSPMGKEPPPCPVD